MPYISNSEQDIKQMMGTIGISSFNELIANIPGQLLFDGDLKIPQALSELEVHALVNEIAAKNKQGICFLGGGSYDHYVPAVVDAITSRSEFYTAYTPYQPEVSQGNLQTIYEFQSMICALTGMEVTNASMYEGGSALAEAALLACSHTRRNKILLAATLNPRYRSILETYVRFNNLELVTIPEEDLTISPERLASLIDDQTAAVIMQQPNFFGHLENMQAIGELLAGRKSLFIASYDPISLGIITPPGEYNADIAVAEGQVLGNRMNFGGPYIGLFSAKQELVRKIPGRIAGIAQDRRGQRGFVLTLQTREQHIRREKATSNICTNSGLLAVAAAVYMSLIGKQGLIDIAELCLQKSHYLAEKLTEIPGISLAGKQPFFKEFTLQFDRPVAPILKKMNSSNIFAGIDLAKYGMEDRLLVAVTEKRTRKELDLYAEIMQSTLIG